MNYNGKNFSKRDIEKKIGNILQLGGTTHFEYSSGRAKGVRAVEFNTGTGLVFTAVPDRGLDIFRCSYRGTSLVYITPNGMTNPAFFEPQGFGWLRTFFGGLLTTCGLTYFGEPGRDENEELGLHGRYSTTPADRLCDLSRWEDDEYILEVSGNIEECSLFGDKLVMRRTISSAIGKSSFRIHDLVENNGFKTSPFTILYHINIGFPLLDASSELVLTSREAEPYDEVSKAGINSMKRFSAPVPGFREQNFLHRMSADQEGFAYAGFFNRELADGQGIFIKFGTKALPFLSEWKMMGEKDYVAGLEPCNTKIANRAELRKSGRLPVIEPGETKEMELEIGVLDGKEEIERFINKTGELLK